MSTDDSSTPSDGRAEPDAEEPSSDGDEKCFVIAPIDSPGSDARKRTNGILNEAIRPVVEEEYGYKVTASHEIAETGSIPQQVITRLLSAEIVVADLTERNPNVMYELAVRHATGLPIIPIDNEDGSLPFDVATERTIPYENAIHGPTQLKNSLREAVDEIEERHEPDNPIYRAQKNEDMRDAIG